MELVPKFCAEEMLDYDGGGTLETDEFCEGPRPRTPSQDGGVHHKIIKSILFV